eukprot:CAMPEP_0168622140 /NCGR_PEP_ID=MMETSP0449_2-20121227/8095_1 /TAXON_ID=1082188 /ORGANISM="Strombidium rassoulzadegani, Strain ras09" /LENGTH=68 /DNA_ID=CAMNT_0008663359 /DNA_START=244 /DNA_END=450 /DNA_ORIENTATION=+
MRGKLYPGLKKLEMRELCPDLVIADDQDVTEDLGWHRKVEHLETTEEMIERIKGVLKDLKAMQKKNPD